MDSRKTNKSPSGQSQSGGVGRRRSISNSPGRRLTLSSLSLPRSKSSVEFKDEPTSSPKENDEKMRKEKRKSNTSCSSSATPTTPKLQLDPPKGSSGCRKWLMFAGGAVFVAAVVGLLLYFILRSSHKVIDDSTEQTPGLSSTDKPDQVSLETDSHPGSLATDPHPGSLATDHSLVSTGTDVETSSESSGSEAALAVKIGSTLGCLAVLYVIAGVVINCTPFGHKLIGERIYDLKNRDFNEKSIVDYRRDYGVIDFRLEHPKGTDDEGISLGVWYVPPKPKEGTKNYAAYTKEIKENFACKKEEKKALATKRILGDPGTVILVVHGDSGDRYSAEMNALFVEDLQWHTIYFDYRGNGDSTPSKHTFKGLVADTRLVYDWLVSVTTVHVVWGHSLGAAVLIDMLAGLTQEQSPWGAMLLGTPVTFEKFSASKSSKCSSCLKSALCVNCFARGANSHYDWNSLRTVGQIKIPILLIHAEDDEIASYADARKLYDEANRSQPANRPNATFHTIDRALGCGHKNFSCMISNVVKPMLLFLLSL